MAPHSGGRSVRDPTNMFVTNMFVYGEIMPTQPTSPSSRRNRPAKPALTREGIVSTAVEILRSEGLQKLTMRRLALELDTGPASMYVYVRNTAELHAAVLDTLLGVVDLAENSSGTWQARLERVLTSYTAVLFDHPGLAQSALVSPTQRSSLRTPARAPAGIARRRRSPSRSSRVGRGLATAVRDVHCCRTLGAEQFRRRGCPMERADRRNPERKPADAPTRRKTCNSSTCR